MAGKVPETTRDILIWVELARTSCSWVTPGGKRIVRFNYRLGDRWPMAESAKRSIREGKLRAENLAPAAGTGKVGKKSSKL
jgi:hypothetical protein